MGRRYRAKLGCYQSRSHESMANVHPHNSLFGEGNRLKTTQAFFKNTCELYVTSLSLSEEVKISIVGNISKSLIRSTTICCTHPVNLIIHYVKELKLSRQICALIKIATRTGEVIVAVEH